MALASWRLGCNRAVLPSYPVNASLILSFQVVAKSRPEGVGSPAGALRVGYQISKVDPALTVIVPSPSDLKRIARVPEAEGFTIP